MDKQALLKAVQAHPARQCKQHDFLVVSWKKTDKSEHASQLMCRRCLWLVNFADAAQLSAGLKTMLNKLSAAEVPQTAADSSRPDI